MKVVNENFISSFCQTLNGTYILTDGIFETGAHGVTSKSQNQTILGPVSKITPVKCMFEPRNKMKM